MKQKTVIKKGDLIVIFTALLLAAILFVVILVWRNSDASQGLVAEVYLDGQLYRTIALTDTAQELRIDSGAGYNVLHIGPQGVAVTEADCRSQDCVRAGSQSHPGGVIACLPHRLLICLTGGKEAEFDAITR